ncbi:hypothetical protein KUTeg_020593 [Tegillarca granosa]|uniref:Major facilitator superfamily (MFS) profile domain-containing protein n=1 Tax=Tegillarca granosa TaxID=220873 RepID=A0ABQ9EB35_TEGGR|nr:hypothetical protein KUTeg_020593 [Tegillarca granosa]
MPKVKVSCKVFRRLLFVERGPLINEEVRMTTAMAAVLRKRQILVFLVGWLAYASTYFLRKPLGVIKTDLMENIHLDKVQLGWLDMGLLFPYAFMQATFGQWSNFYILFALLFLNGTAQAQCWPNCMKSLGSWYPDSVRNSVFGMFGTCAFAGGIIGTSLAVYLQTSYGWRSVFLPPSVIVLKYSKGEAGMFSTVFEIGGVLGSAGIGFVMDRYFKGRALLGTGFSVFLSALALLCFLFTSSWGIVINCLFLFIAGAFNCGPDSILGFGSVGTVLEGPIIGIVSSHYGFSGMFVLMIILSFIGTVSVFRGASIYNSKVVRKIPEPEPLDPDIV